MNKILIKIKNIMSEKTLRVQIPYIFSFFISLSASPTCTIKFFKVLMEVDRKYAWGNMTWKDAWLNRGSYFIDFGIPHYNEGGIRFSFRKSNYWVGQ